jgi:UTP--glucose-1-phosphate uridylyltransferase
MKTVKKAVIPAAGLGTRFLPATKTVPKEMLPVVDRPALLFNIEEATRAGIEDIVIVAGRGKSAIEDFFDRSYELEDTLARAGKEDALKSLQNIRNLANVISIRQKEALGLGHAVYAARPVVGDEPFAVLLGDEIMIGKPGVTAELAATYAKTGLSTVAVMEVPEGDVSKYGIVGLEDSKAAVLKISEVVEKPSPAEAPSRLALPGRYVFSPKIFELLQKTKPGKNGEIQLTDAMKVLAKTEGLIAQKFTDRRFDTGDKLGFLTANIELALEHPEIGAKLKTYIRQLGERL